MDRKALRARLETRSNEAIERALDAMEKAPLDNIVSGSEVQIHEVFERLKREVFQELVQVKVEEVEAAARPSFSPSAGPTRAGAASPVEGQGRAGAAPLHPQR